MQQLKHSIQKEDGMEISLPNRAERCGDLFQVQQRTECPVLPSRHTRRTSSPYTAHTEGEKSQKRKKISKFPRRLMKNSGSIVGGWIAEQANQVWAASSGAVSPKTSLQEPSSGQCQVHRALTLCWWGHQPAQFLMQQVFAHQEQARFTIYQLALCLSA